MPSLSSASGRRTFLLVVSAIVTAYFMIGFFVGDYRPVNNIMQLNQRPLHEKVSQITENVNSEPANLKLSPTVLNLANATFIMLCKNDELEGVLSSVRQIEDRFNKKFGYPWVLLNNEPFAEDFKERVAVITNSPVYFGQIPSEHWNQPDWIDDEKALSGRLKMQAQGIIYAGELHEATVAMFNSLGNRFTKGSVSYRNMCRFNSGFFYLHDLLKPYRYYWRVEPNVKYFCDLDYDPFKFMQENNKIYGFTISLVEWVQTIPTLWSTVKEFIANHTEYLHPDNAMSFLSNDGGNNYNMCHFWSNFEIADMDFWRGEAYSKFFGYLESKGGFYYERWGDAPVHSIAVSLLASKEQIHFFDDIGYRHESFQHCPQGESWYKGRCACDPRNTFDYHYNSCMNKFLNLFPASNTSEAL